jgi:hypothetical protein
MHPRATRGTRLLLIAALAALPAVVGAAADGQRTRPGATPPGTSPPQAPAAYSRTDAETIAARLYRGLLGREGDSAGLAVATSEVIRGNLAGQVNSMVQSPEFRQKAQQVNASQLLDQFFAGLLGRKPDSSAVSAYLQKMQTMRYAEVAMSIINSAEFKQSLSGTPSQGRPPVAPAVSNLDAALDCQARVMDRLRRDAPGRPFLSFDHLPEVNGQAVRGQAVDRFDRDRHVAYSCDGTTTASYAYADGRQPNGGNRQLQFPSNAVKDCMYQISRGTTFDAAALSASDSNLEYVIGWVGGDQYRCTMDRGRVLDLKKK